jgi:pimeloyl-ACP methyl ester carboxylesterase
MGGMVIQKYLEEHIARAVVLMSSVPPQGLLGSAFGLAFAKPHLLGDLNSIMGGGQPQMETLRDAMFYETIEPERLQRYYHLSQPESHRAIWDMSLFALPFLSRMNLPPMLVLGAEHDVLIPQDQVRMTARTYGVSATILPGLGHGMMMESDWRIAADPIIDWLKSQDL